MSEPIFGAFNRFLIPDLEDQYQQWHIKYQSGLKVELLKHLTVASMLIQLHSLVTGSLSLQQILSNSMLHVLLCVAWARPWQTWFDHGSLSLFNQGVIMALGMVAREQFQRAIIFVSITRTLFSLYCARDWLAHVGFLLIDFSVLVFEYMLLFFFGSLTSDLSLPSLIVGEGVELAVVLVFGATIVRLAEVSHRTHWHAQRVMQDALATEQSARINAERMIAFLSHEVRNPQAAIIMAVEGLLSQAHSDPSRRSDLQSLEIIKSSSEAVTVLLEDVMNLQRISEGLLKLDFLVFDLNTFMRQMGDVYGPMLRTRQITFKMELDPNVPTQVVGDKNRIRQILTNFVTNAAKFTPVGGSVILSMTLLEHGPIENDPDGGGSASTEEAAYLNCIFSSVSESCIKDKLSGACEVDVNSAAENLSRSIHHPESTIERLASLNQLSISQTPHSRILDHPSKSKTTCNASSSCDSSKASSRDASPLTVAGRPPLHPILQRGIKPFATSSDTLLSSSSRSVNGQSIKTASSSIFIPPAILLGDPVLTQKTAEVDLAEAVARSSSHYDDDAALVSTESPTDVQSCNPNNAPNSAAILDDLILTSTSTIETSASLTPQRASSICIPAHLMQSESSLLKISQNACPPNESSAALSRRLTSPNVRHDPLLISHDLHRHFGSIQSHLDVTLPPPVASSFEPSSLRSFSPPRRPLLSATASPVLNRRAVVATSAWTSPAIPSAFSRSPQSNHLPISASPLLGTSSTSPVCGKSLQVQASPVTSHQATPLSNQSSSLFIANSASPHLQHQQLVSNFSCPSLSRSSSLVMNSLLPTSSSSSNSLIQHHSSGELMPSDLNLTHALDQIDQGAAVQDPPRTIWARFAVRDSGIGIAPDDLHKLFQPYSQIASGISAQKGGGAGLGLSICKGLVELHGGRIGVLSDKGEGSEFWFEIPFQVADSVTTPPSSSLPRGLTTDGDKCSTIPAEPCNFTAGTSTAAPSISSSVAHMDSLTIFGLQHISKSSSSAFAQALVTAQSPMNCVETKGLDSTRLALASGLSTADSSPVTQLKIKVATEPMVNPQTSSVFLASGTPVINMSVLSPKSTEMLSDSTCPHGGLRKRRSSAWINPVQLSTGAESSSSSSHTSQSSTLTKQSSFGRSPIANGAFVLKAASLFPRSLAEANAANAKSANSESPTSLISKSSISPANLEDSIANLWTDSQLMMSSSSNSSSLSYASSAALLLGTSQLSFNEVDQRSPIGNTLTTNATPEMDYPSPHRIAMIASVKSVKASSSQLPSDSVSPSTSDLRSYPKQQSFSSPSTVNIKHAAHNSTDFAASKRKTQSTPSRRPRVLVVEDNAFISNLLVRSLDGIGYDSQAVGSGNEALDLFQFDSSSSSASDFPFDLVLMDYIMPGLNGVETIAALRSRGFKAPIIGLTGNSANSDICAFRAAGAQDVLIKPVRPHELQSCLSKHLILQE